jgi:hypothetical protein
LDDTLFVRARWVSANYPADLAVYPGGVHGFDFMPLEIAAQCLDRGVWFVRGAVTKA